jgi:hypothetical protein
MKRIASLALLFFALSWSACGDGGSTSTGTGGGAGTTGASTSGSGAGGSTGAPQAPIMQSVSPLAGGLHVVWMNVTPNCDKILLDRKKDAGAYATAYTLTGADTSKHDDQAIAPGTYCYKARCQKGAQTSPDSNEKCGTP